MTTPHSDHFLVVNDTRTRYWTLGESQSPIILLHGLGCYVEYWRDNIASLAKKRCTYAVDLPGFGLSDKPQVTLSIPYLMEFLREFMDALGIDRAVLIGASMGGAIALRFALHHSDRVERLVLAGSAGLGREISILLRVLTVPILGEMASRPSRMGTAMLLAQLFHDPKLISDQRVTEALEMRLLAGSQRCLLSALRSMCNLWGQRKETYQPILDRLGEVRVPTMIAWGEQDRILPVSHGRIAAQLMPNARLHVIDQCGHMPNVEHPQEFNILVSDFLTE